MLNFVYNSQNTY